MSCPWVHVINAVIYPVLAENGDEVRLSISEYVHFSRPHQLTQS